MQVLTMSISESTQVNVIVLISCVSKKANTDAGPVAAKDLYQSPLFIKSLDYASTILGVREDHIFILSAAHHLLPLDQPVLKYDKSLNKFSVAQRKAWADKVWSQLNSRFGPNTHYIILAGKNYYQYLIGDGRITDYKLPFGKRPIGQRLSVLNSAISNKTIITY